MKKLKLLFLNANYRGVGTFHRALGIARSFAARGHHVDFVTMGREHWTAHEEWLNESLRLVEAPSLGHTLVPGWGYGPLDIRYRLGMVRSNQYDFIYGFEYHPNVRLPSWVGRRRGVRFLNDWCDLHGGAANKFRGLRIAHKLDRLLEESIRKRAELVTVISTLLFQRCLEIGIPEERVMLIREGVDSTRIFPVPTGEARAAIGLPNDRPIIGYGSDHFSELAVLAFKKALGIVPDAVLLVLGKEDRAVRRAAEQLGITNRVIETGWVPEEEIAFWTSAPDVWMLPLQDTMMQRARWPHKIGEYLAAGKPVVVSDVGDIGQFVRDHQVGYVSPPGDLGSLGSDVARLLDDRMAAQKLGQHAVSVARSHLAWDAISAPLIDFVESERS